MRIIDERSQFSHVIFGNKVSLKWGALLANNEMVTEYCPIIALSRSSSIDVMTLTKDSGEHSPAHKTQPHMRHFIAYHNAKKIGYSSETLPSPRVKTKKPVVNLEGVTVWLIAGEGKSPKSYFLAAKFVANNCEQNKFSGSSLPNEISGPGHLFKFTIPITGTSLLELIRAMSHNFRNGFHEVSDTRIIDALVRLA